MFQITDRTMPRLHVQQPSKGIPAPSAPPITQAEFYNKLANDIRQKKRAFQTTNKPKIETIQEVAERIKQNRLAIKTNLPLPVEKELKPIYLDKNGNQCVAKITTHCLDQFNKRVKLVKTHLDFQDEKDLWACFCEHFNKAKRMSTDAYRRRHQIRREAETPFILGGDFYAFVVKPCGTALTFELRGKYKHLNRFHTRKKTIDEVA